MITREHTRDVLRSWRLTPWRLRVTWHTARSEYHRLRGDYWRIINDARRGARVEPFTPEERRELDQLHKRIGVRENVRMSPFELVDLIRHASDPVAAKIVARWQEDSATARRCWELNHQGRLDRYEREARERFEAEVRSRA